MTSNSPRYPAFMGERVRLARTARGLSQEDLARKVDLTRPAISQIESGKRGIDSVELVAISKALQKPLEFFLEDSPDEETQFSILFRADEISETDRVIVEDFRDLCRSYSHLEHLLQLEAKIDIPTWSCSATSQRAAIAEGERIAKDTRNVLSLGSDPISNLSSLLENRGIRVWKRPLDKSSAWGFSVTSSDLGWCIFVNSACSATRQNFTLAHEFGHLIMDHNHKTTIYSEAASIELGKPSRDLHESRANAFAAAFLMPEDGLKEIVSRYHIASSRDMSGFVVDFLRQYYSVSYEAMLWRLLSLQMISSAQRESLWDARPKAQEHLHLSEVEPTLPSRYRTLALEAYRNTKISIGKLADFLKQDVYETRQMLKDLALVQLEQ